MTACAWSLDLLELYQPLPPSLSFPLPRWPRLQAQSPPARGHPLSFLFFFGSGGLLVSGLLDHRRGVSYLGSGGGRIYSIICWGGAECSFARHKSNEGMLVGIQGTCNKDKIKNHKFKSHLMKNLPFPFSDSAGEWLPLHSSLKRRQHWQLSHVFNGWSELPAGSGEVIWFYAPLRH